MRNMVQTVDRALSVLLAFDSEDELRVTELAGRLGVHRSTASRIAATLEARGFLERVPASDAFRLGPELGRIGLLASGARRLGVLARGEMERLAAERGETVTLAVLAGEDALTIAQVDGRYFVASGSWVAARTPLHCTSDGKVLLAFDGVELPDGPLEARTRRTITSRDDLRRELETVRREGWAHAIGELEDGLNGVAAPVLDSAERCRAALSVSGPSYRVSPDALPELAARCKEAAGAIGAQLVWSSNGA